MLQEPAEFQTAVQGLLRAQKQSIEANSTAGGEHLCFMGSGRPEEDSYTYMVIAKFLQQKTRYISLLSGGFAAIHDYFGEHMLDCLEDHDSTKCIVCVKQNNGNTAPTTPEKRATANNNNNAAASTSESTKPKADLFGRISSVIKLKDEVKGKLFAYIANPQPQVPLGERHVAASERHGARRYRNVAPVFSIDDGDDDTDGVAISDDKEKASETVQLSTFLKGNGIQQFFRCQEVHMNGFMHDSCLAFTDTHIIVLRQLLGTGDDNARIIAKRPLNSIVKITAKKRHRDLITFKYGVPDGETLIVTDMDRFLIPNASEATQVISKMILKQL